MIIQTDSIDRAIRYIPIESAANDHEYVDLGLPSGTLWAKYNVGSEGVIEYGLKYMWGDPEYHGAPSGDVYSLYSGNKYTKYTASDLKYILEDEDDIARVNMGGLWRLPTRAQCIELLSLPYTSVDNYQDSGVNGRLFTGTNGNALFLPYGGVAVGNSGQGNRTTGYYMTNMLNYNGYNNYSYLIVDSSGSRNHLESQYGRTNSAVSCRGVLNKNEIYQDADNIRVGEELIYTSLGLKPIVFEDPAVESILLAQFDTDNKGYITLRDCRNVRTLGTIFKNKTSITKFNELKYFTRLDGSGLTGAFDGCSNLQEVTIPINEHGYLYTMANRYYSGYSIFNNCSNLTTIHWNNVEIEPLQTMGLYSRCTQLLYSLDLIPPNVTIIPTNMFIGCKLGEVVLPDLVVQCNSGAFNASGITYLVTGKNFTTINLADITRDATITSGIPFYFRNPNLVVTLSSTSTSYNRKIIFYVPDALLSAYQADENWQTVLANNSSWELKSDSELPAELQQYKLNDE